MTFSFSKFVLVIILAFFLVLADEKSFREKNKFRENFREKKNFRENFVKKKFFREKLKILIFIYFTIFMMSDGVLRSKK
jgi:hypothetical protein